MSYFFGNLQIMTEAMTKLCVITPYHKEERSLLELCIESVRAQTIKSDHIFVADGFPADWIDKTTLRPQPSPHFAVATADGKTAAPASAFAIFPSAA
jgi:hypothetical protein